MTSTISQLNSTDSPNITSSILFETTTQNTTTTTAPGPNLWTQPSVMFFVSVVYLSVNFATSILSNSLLIIIINYSPSLKTPANSHVINICANNIVLCLCMLLSIVSFALPEANIGHEINILSGIHIFLVTNCFFQYLSTFASIGYYRSRIIRSPSMTLKNKRQVIARSLTISWIVSVIFSLVTCLAHIDNDSDACVTLNPFQKQFLLCDDNFEISIRKLTIISFNIVLFVMICAVIVSSYYRIFKTFNHGMIRGRNRVLPLQRSFSLPSELGDITNRIEDAYTHEASMSETDKSVYIVSKGKHSVSRENGSVVHYQKNERISILTYEDILALENPILAANIRNQMPKKRTLELARSNASNHSVKSKCPDFTDISASNDLSRYQQGKTAHAVRNHILQRDRAGYNTATKNSLVMLLSFFVCSLPMFVCAFPNVMPMHNQKHRVLILLFTTLTFCLNAPIYPLWYLIHNHKVRKCLNRVVESALVALKIRR